MTVSSSAPSSASTSTPSPRPPRDSLLAVNDLQVSYGVITALTGVSLTVGQGEIVALIGANGAGKTSTLRAISGMLRPKAGTVTLDGEGIGGKQSHELVPLGMAHAPEGRGIFLNLSVDENLTLGAYLKTNKQEIEADRKQAFDLFPRLLERRHQRAGTLSGGEQQMLAVGRALMSRPRLLLLDEPSLGLAPQVIEKIFSILKAINEKGVSILLVEQNAHLALGLCHYAYVLETGAVVMEGTGKDLLKSDEIRKAYLGE